MKTTRSTKFYNEWIFHTNLTCFKIDCFHCFFIKLSVTRSIIILKTDYKYYFISKNSQPKPLTITYQNVYIGVFFVGTAGKITNAFNSKFFFQVWFYNFNLGFYFPWRDHAMKIVDF